MQVNLSWASVANALYYNVYRSPFSGGPYLIIGQSNPNPGQTSVAANIVTTYQDGPNNLSNGLDYYYVVTTVTNDGESAYSSEYHAGPTSQPPSPIHFTGVTT